MENELNMNNAEISDEVMKELKINSIEEYRKVVMNDKNTKIKE